MRKKVILEPSVFLWQTPGQGFLYDSATASFLHFPLTDTGIRSLSSQWEDIDNLYVAHYDDDDEQVLSFVRTIVKKGFGKVYDEDAPVVSFPPVFKINRSVEHKELWGGIEAIPILPLLSHLRVILGGPFSGVHLNNQDLYPMDSDKCLDLSSLWKFIYNCDLFTLTKVDLVVSDWNERLLLSIVEGVIQMDFKKKVRFFFADPDPGFKNEILTLLATEGFAVTQICPPDVRIEKADWIKGRDYQLLVRSNEDVAHWESLLGEDDSIKYDFKPIADNNLEFFRENVFLSEEEILSQKLTKKDIFRHQALNVSQFGIFYIFPDGTVHPAADAPAIGTLEDSVHQMIIRELEENFAWRQTRRLMEPCKYCIYCDLCPSPTIYERIIGVPGCTYWKE